MKHSLLFALCICLTVFLDADAQSKKETARFRDEVEADLTGNILPFWMEKVTDPAGGFYDIETAWLLTETADILKDRKLKKSIRQQVIDLTDEALSSGLSPEGAMQDEKTSRGIRERYSWWSQCETITKDCRPADEQKANEWHGPYHNGHMAFEIVERL